MFRWSRIIMWFCSSNEKVTGVNCGWRECFPDNGLANIGGNEERYSAPQSISFLEKLVQQQHDKSSDEQLNNNQKTNTSSNFSWISVHSGHYVNDSLPNGNDHAKHCVKMKRMSLLLRLNGNTLKFMYLHFCAPLNNALSFGVSPTSIIFAPWSSCIIRPEVTIGEIPNSMRVPLFDASITRIQ